MESERKIKKEIKTLNRVFVLVLVLVVVAWLATGFLLVDYIDSAERGKFGDMFGVINALFSGLAFAGVIYAVLLQRKELECQREELRAQNTTLKKQNFENTFFQLLRLHNEITNSIEFAKLNNKAKGKRSFYLFYIELTDYYRALEEQGLNREDRINKAYLRFYGINQNDVSHYFRNLYAIVKFIESSDVENVELYVNLIRAQLTNNELLLLFYHSLGGDRNGLKPIIEKYTLFESLPRVNLLNQKEHESLYKDSAYNKLSINVCN